MARKNRSESTARPANRKGAQRTKISKTGSSRSTRKVEPTARVEEASQPRRRFAEPPKVAGELPVPKSTFYF
ncbi:MAG: hypothetical protein H6708_03640 [Kofleriaceae bacterium]|nr:hypothetical protein [Myxococcales bacterium]MCB9559479.1 hypothetical protein [Kofleriaceae bacterium]